MGSRTPDPRNEGRGFCYGRGVTPSTTGGKRSSRPTPQSRALALAAARRGPTKRPRFGQRTSHNHRDIVPAACCRHFSIGPSRPHRAARRVGLRSERSRHPTRQRSRSRLGVWPRPRASARKPRALERGHRLGAQICGWREGRCSRPPGRPLAVSGLRLGYRCRLARGGGHRLTVIERCPAFPVGQPKQVGKGVCLGQQIDRFRERQIGA